MTGVLKDMQKFNKLEEKGTANSKQNSEATTEKHGVMEEMVEVWYYGTQGACRQEWQEIKRERDSERYQEGSCSPQLGVEGRMMQ